MSSYLEYKDSVAFHPGYYIKELIDESGLTQADFAKRLDTTPKNLSLLVRGEQRLSVDMAMKLSKMLGTSIQYWLNLQNAYDTLVAEIASDKQLEHEKCILKLLGYEYFRDNFGLPNLPHNTTEQVIAVRTFLRVASLSVLTNRDMAVSFRSSSREATEQAIVKANAMVQIAVNETIDTPSPAFDRKKFDQAIDFVLTQTNSPNGFYQAIKEELLAAGVVLVVLPNLPGSTTNGATKKIGKRVMIMVNDRSEYADTFWFTLLHEAGHVANDDLGISFVGETGTGETIADRYAEDKLIEPSAYAAFIDAHKGVFTKSAVVAFAESINRSPGIVVGRLENDGYVARRSSLNSLRDKYRTVLN
jgi:addiction module HigA family antidote